MFYKEFIPDAVLLAGGDYPTGAIPLGLLKSAEYVVCCDGAANEYIERGNIPNAIIGDGDSLTAINREKYSDILHIIEEQESNDQTKAIHYLIAKGYKRIAILGATGKREDHTIGNISLLLEYMKLDIEVRSVTNYGVFIPVRDTQEFETTVGAQISIFNLNATFFNSIGLKYPIYDFTAWWQGTLNEATNNNVKIEAKGEYIVYLLHDNALYL